MAIQQEPQVKRNAAVAPVGAGLAPASANRSLLQTAFSADVQTSETTRARDGMSGVRLASLEGQRAALQTPQGQSRTKRDINIGVGINTGYPYPYPGTPPIVGGPPVYLPQPLPMPYPFPGGYPYGVPPAPPGYTWRPCNWVESLWKRDIQTPYGRMCLEPIRHGRRPNRGWWR